MVVAILLAAALAAERASPLDAAVRPERPRGTGIVAYVTATKVYLDAGAEDGLAEGAVLDLRRGAEAVGRCRVEVVAPHQAVCSGAPARPGDSFRFDPVPAAAADAAAVKVLPPPPDDAEVARRLTVVTAAPQGPLVEYKAPPAEAAAVPRSRTLEAALTHASWASSEAGPSHRESLDVVIRGAEVADGLTLDVDARAEHWLRRESPRFRPNDDTQLYLWQAQLTATPSDALVLSAGRVLPWSIPGATIFDGAVAGVRRRSGDLRVEGGLFGGLVPDPVTTAPTTSRSTGGGYWVLDGLLGRGASFRQEGRVAVVHSPELGTRYEASLTGGVFLRLADLSAEAHLGTGGSASGGLDAGRVDLTLRPVQGLVIGGDYREARLAWPQPFDPPAFPGRSRAADAFAYVDVGRAVRIGAVGGFAKDLDSGLDRSWLGPELALPRLLGARGGVTVGYLEEKGWLDGRSAYAQIVARPWDPVRLLARLTWAHDQAAGIDRDEVGVYASAAADLTRNLALRLSLLSRAAVALEGEGGTTPYGLTGFASLVLSL